MEASKKYIDGFNSGYILRQHKPELAKSLFQTLEASNDYTQGLKDGNQAYEKELDKEILRFAEKHERDKNLQPDPEKNHEKGKGYDIN